MKSGWTHGQFSIYKVVFGLYLLQHFLFLLPWGGELFSSAGVLPDGSMSVLIHLFPNVFALEDSTLFIDFVLLVCVGLSACLLAEKWQRYAAVLLWYFWACLYGRDPLIGNPSLPFIGWLLLAHAFIPRPSRHRPLGERDESAASWCLPQDIYLSAWIVMAAAYTYSGYTKLLSPSWIDGSALSRILSNPLARDTVVRTFLLSLPAGFLKTATWGALALELSFAPLALWRRSRPLVWSAMVALHLGLVLLINFADLTMGMLILHFFTLDPAWIAKPAADGQLILFDGECALCHGLVRFVLREDHSARPFRFAPLQGNMAHHTIAPTSQPQPASSLVVVIGANKLLMKSDAVGFVLERLGGLWWLSAQLIKIVPRAMRDLAYDAVASFRKIMFGGTRQVCPVVPLPWRERMLE